MKITIEVDFQKVQDRWRAFKMFMRTDLWTLRQMLEDAWERKEYLRREEENTKYIESLREFRDPQYKKMKNP